MNRSVVALGGNLPLDGHSPVQTFKEVIRVLTQGTDHQLRGLAQIWRSRPVRAEGPDFLNTVAWIDTPLTAMAWLERLLSAEAQFGRVRSVRSPVSLETTSLPGLSPARSLDLDLIWFEDMQSDSPQLALPHPRASQRGFVLGPMCDLPQALLSEIRLPCPRTGEPQSVQTLWNALPTAAREGLERLDSAAVGWCHADAGEATIA